MCASIGPLDCQGSLAAKERSLQTGQAACVASRAGRRACSLRAFSRPNRVTATQDDLSGPAGTLICARPDKNSSPSKQVLAIWGRRGRGIECVSSSPPRPVLIQTLLRNNVQSLRAWRSETATHLHPLCSHPQRALLLRTPPRCDSSTISQRGLHRCGASRRNRSIQSPLLLR